MLETIKKEKVVNEKVVKEKKPKKEKKKNDKVQTPEEIQEMLHIDKNQYTELEAETRRRLQEINDIKNVPQRLIRSSVRALYLTQRCRIQIGNQIMAIFKVKLGQQPGKSEDQLKEEQKKILDFLKKEYKKITSAAVEALELKKNPKRIGAVKNPTITKMAEYFEKQGYITDRTEFILVETYSNLVTQEEQITKDLSELIHEHPLWNYCKTIKGIGEITTAILISEIDIHKVKYPSQILSLAGICPGPDGKGLSMKEEHLVLRPYISKNDKFQIKKSIKFNPFLKTKCMGVVAGSLIKHNPTFRQIWKDYRTRIINRPDCKDYKPMRTMLMANRYMLKWWIIDLYKAWRTMEGLPVEPSYEEKKLGMTHTQTTCMTFPTTQNKEAEDKEISKIVEILENQEYEYKDIED